MHKTYQYMHNKTRVISFLGVQTNRQRDRQKDRHGFGIIVPNYVGTQKFLTQSSKLRVSCQLLYTITHPQVTGMHN